MSADTPAASAPQVPEVWRADHTALVHVLWEAKHTGLTVDDADELAPADPQLGVPAGRAGAVRRREATGAVRPGDPVRRMIRVSPDIYRVTARTEEHR